MRAVNCWAGGTPLQCSMLEQPLFARPQISDMCPCTLGAAGHPAASHRAPFNSCCAAAEEGIAKICDVGMARHQVSDLVTAQVGAVCGKSCFALGVGYTAWQARICACGTRMHGDSSTWCGMHALRISPPIPCPMAGGADAPVGCARGGAAGAGVCQGGAAASSCWLGHFVRPCVAGHCIIALAVTRSTFAAEEHRSACSLHNAVLMTQPTHTASPPCSVQADMWSFGILIFEIVTGADIVEHQPLAYTKQVQQVGGPGRDGAGCVHFCRLLVTAGLRVCGGRGAWEGGASSRGGSGALKVTAWRCM